ncbi:MAG TPA: HAD family phosphatase [bacterium]|nr:HAD family phosphatase [bacterium]
MDTVYGLIFDVDGVIADTEGVNARATGRVFLDLFGVEGVTRDDFEAGIGRGAEAYVEAGAQAHGITLSEQQLRQAVQAREDYFLRLLAEQPLKPFPGVENLVGAGLRDDRCRLAIATSGSRKKSQAVLESAGISYKQMVYITGDDVTRKKPDPELFLTAADRLRIPPERCLVVEDAPNGVEAAKTAGCKCLAVTNTTDQDHLRLADRVVDSLKTVSLEEIFRIIDREA